MPILKLEHDGFQISCWKTCWKRYDGANIARWNPEIEPFVVQWVIQKEENMHMLGLVEDRKPP